MTLNKQAEKIINDMQSSFKFKLWALFNLPSVFFWGIKVAKLNQEEARVSIPFRWSNKNPFNSIYFAAQAGAAELSTGALALLAIAGKGKYSMLVTNFSASYSKKASSKTIFTCNNGNDFFKTIEDLKNSGDTGTVDAISIGRNTTGEEVAKICITWSFKKK